MRTSAPGSKQARPLPPGFTLVETLLVVVLMMTLSAALAPLLLPSPNTELRRAADDAASALRQTRLAAMRSRQPQVLVVDTRRAHLRPPGGRPTDFAEGIEVQLTTAETELLGAGSGGIRFFPDGSSTGGRLSLSNGDLALHVDVEWLTGRVKLLTDKGT